MEIIEGPYGVIAANGYSIVPLDERGRPRFGVQTPDIATVDSYGYPGAFQHAAAIAALPELIQALKDGILVMKGVVRPGCRYPGDWLERAEAALALLEKPAVFIVAPGAPERALAGTTFDGVKL